MKKICNINYYNYL